MRPESGSESAKWDERNAYELGEGKLWSTACPRVARGGASEVLVLVEQPEVIECDDAPESRLVERLDCVRSSCRKNPC